MNRLKLSAIFALAMLVASCATSQTTYPILDQVTESDPQMSCRMLDDDFFRASNLRGEVLDAHGDAISKAVKDTGIKAVTNPVGAAVSGIMKSVSVSGATKHYTQAAAAAGQRMEQLLRYKRENDCPRTPTRDPSLTDDDVLRLLDEALVRFEAGEITDKEYIEERSRLLDTMRDLNY